MRKLRHQWDMSLPHHYPRELPKVDQRSIWLGRDRASWRLYKEELER